MTALSKPEIISEIKKGKLCISPILSEKQLNPSTVDLRMGNLILLTRASGLSHVDPAKYPPKRKKTEAEPKADASRRKEKFDHERNKQQKHERHEIPFNCKFLLHPGALILVPTLEWFQLPLYLQGVVSARSSWAREGLSIATATFINPGYEGIITLELANLGSIPIAIYPGLRLAQIAFYRTGQPAIRESSQFNLSFEPREGNVADGDGPFTRLRETSLAS